MAKSQKKKSAVEASKNISNIKNTSFASNKTGIGKCPECSLIGQLIPPPKEDGKIITHYFKCPNGHFFSNDITVK